MAEPATLYEAMYILDPRTSDEEAQRITETLQAALTSAGGEFVSDEFFGRRRLAYPIQHQVEGIYRILYFRGDGAVVNEVKHQFALLQPILRGMVVVANPEAIFSAAPTAPAEASAEQAPEAGPAEAAGEGAAAVEEGTEEPGPAETAAETTAEPETGTEGSAEEQAPVEAG